MSNNINIKHKRAYYEYHILEKFDAGIKLLGTPNKASDTITETSTITDYISCTIKKLIQQIIIHKDNNMVIPNELIFHSGTFTYNALKQCISSQEERRRMIDEGKRRASEYYQYKIKMDNL